MSTHDIPLWQQAIVLLFAALVAFLVAWFAIHGVSIPDWLASIMGVFVGFIAHALASSQGNAQAARLVEAASGPAPIDPLERQANT